MTARTSDLLRSNDIDVRQLTPDVDLVDAIRQLSQDPELGCPWSWTLSSLRDDLPWYEQPALSVGVRDAETGALAWQDQPPMVPANGTNTEPVDYWLGGLHHTPMDAHTELPMELVLRAVAEYVRTGERPACVEWIAAR
ncbi:Imm1 family immunity protein [Saccharopolyspora sp. ASAGF58]|uniref:Imm1 family immunity protein n=1 Tax=Saccharopolyspora sp. ASAGF58 TaxID=2719023 RepID=UPI00143FD9D5|nr:Imm1 family immunity protein [Saccharopolyspora sp. ASAGF58]QIZ33484.1 hypothetical protein FDZ84_00440 [Saccharopolyspora sp. ASAGF58]